MKIYLVEQNADFTEGRGPMLPHKVFSTLEKATDYVSKQSGIMGTAQSKTPASYSTATNLYYNGYTIKIMDVE